MVLSYSVWYNKYTKWSYILDLKTYHRYIVELLSMCHISAETTRPYLAVRAYRIYRFFFTQIGVPWYNGGFYAIDPLTAVWQTVRAKNRVPLLVFFEDWLFQDFVHAVLAVFIDFAHFSLAILSRSMMADHIQQQPQGVQKWSLPKNWNIWERNRL